MSFPVGVLGRGGGGDPPSLPPDDGQAHPPPTVARPSSDIEVSGLSTPDVPSTGVPGPDYRFCSSVVQ